MWMQVAGKIAVATGPRLNHCWGSAFHLTARGLSTGVLTFQDRTFTIAFDFIDHTLTIAVTDGTSRTLRLEARSVASFYAAVMQAMRELDLPVRIWSMPVEITWPVRFELDEEHASYEAGAVEDFWQALVAVERVLTAARGRFLGKTSPANFYWGSCDLALTRFSGGLAPSREGPAFMRDAYSHAVISHGFWPGNDQVPEPVFYAYAVPEPDGLRTARIEPSAARYDTTLGEFILPYEAVRTSSAPGDTLRAFIDTSYAQAATLAGWDRQALER
jgi:hypothetical protein